jgi:hypothetical protein
MLVIEPTIGQEWNWPHDMGSSQLLVNERCHWLV